MKTVLMTGGAGFIGSNLVPRLLSKNLKVICLDNFDPFYDHKIKQRNIYPFRADKNFLFVKGDIRDSALLKRVFKKYEINKVVHLAARPGIAPSIKNPSLYEKINVQGTLTLLEAVRSSNVTNFVFASSSSVYGQSTKIPFNETLCAAPISPYGATKLAGENYCRIFNKLYGMNIACLRFFTVYGPRQRPDMAIHKFVKSIDKGVPVNLYGRGLVKRDFTFVSDAVDSVLSSMNKKFGFEIMNIGNSKPITLNYLISLIEDELGKKAKIIYKPLPQSEAKITCADISKARRTLGYRPKTSIERGIEKFVAWYKNE